MTEHIHIPIKTALELARGNRADQKHIKALFGYNRLVDLTNDLLMMQNKGMTVIPGEGCDNQATTGVCQGHPDKVPV